MKEVKLEKPIPLVAPSYNPFLSFKRELNKLMQDLHVWLEPSSFPVRSFENLTIMPAADVIDEKDHFKVEIEMPGMGEEDIKLSIIDGLLVIKGEKTVSKQDEGKNYMTREISYGCYERKIPLPESVDADKAKASFKKGMLWVDIPKKPESIKKSRVLEIETVK